MADSIRRACLGASASEDCGRLRLPMERFSLSRLISMGNSPAWDGEYSGF
jgi:hypothetical protein